MKGCWVNRVAVGRVCAGARVDSCGKSGKGGSVERFFNFVFVSLSLCFVFVFVRVHAENQERDKV